MGIVTGLFWVLAGVIYVLYKVFHDEKPMHKRMGQSDADCRRQLELSRNIEKYTQDILGVSLEDVRDGKTMDYVHAVAVAEIMRREDKKYAATYGCHGDVPCPYVDRFREYVNGARQTAKQRSASLQLAYKTNKDKFLKQYDKYVIKASKGFHFCFGDQPGDIIKIAIYKILLSEGYYFSDDDKRFLSLLEEFIKNTERLYSMPRCKFEALCGGTISDTDNKYRGDLVKLIGEKEGWLKGEVRNKRWIENVGFFDLQFICGFCSLPDKE